MSWSAGYLAVREAIKDHVIAAWGGTVFLGTMGAAQPARPYALIALSESATSEENLTPVTKVSAMTIMVGGTFDRPATGEALEEFAAEKAEALRILIDTDHHLGDSAISTEVSSIQWALPSAIDPNMKMIHVDLTIQVLMEYDRT